jgi:hypothetical protein
LCRNVTENGKEQRKTAKNITPASDMAENKRGRPTLAAG